MMTGILRAKGGGTLIVACCCAIGLHASTVCEAGLATPLMAQAGAGLVAPGGVDALAKPTKQLPAGAQKMADNFNKAGTADAAQPGSGPAPGADAGTSDSKGLSEDLVKYAPSYVLMVLAIGLGLFVVCRPAGFSLAKLAEKKPKN